MKVNFKKAPLLLIQESAEKKKVIVLSQSIVKGQTLMDIQFLFLLSKNLTTINLRSNKHFQFSKTLLLTFSLKGFAKKKVPNCIYFD
jgi:hypothetical protein